MDDSNMHANDRKSGANTNGSTRRSLGSSQLQQGSPVRPTSLMDSPTQHPGAYTIIQVVVNRDDKGYGMKVSGDNPVYVQSVKAGGAAEKAGLYAGDKIIEVNGENVMSSTHTDVVALIRSASQVVLTVQQRIRGKRMESPSLQTSRSMSSPSSHQITGPQPVDHEKMHQLQVQKKQHIMLMMEKEERYLEMLRSQLALSPTEKKCAELEKTERNLLKLQGMLQGNLVTNEQSPPPLSRNIFSDIQTSQTLPSKICRSGPDMAPPLPRRNRSQGCPVESADSNGNRRNANYANGTRGPKAGPPGLGPPMGPPSNINRNNNNNGFGRDGRVVDDQQPPPLPPRNQPRPPLLLPDFDLDAANSIGKQLSYPLVTTCATLINNYSLNHGHHHRTKSSPESLLMLTPAEASRRLIASESTTDLGPEGFGENATPPGTPPPPYPHASPEVTRKHAANRECEVDSHDDHDPAFTTSSALDTSNIALISSEIKAASSHVAQQQIISMEDDEMSDQEVNQLDDHGPFKSLSRLWEHRPHLAVFMNYVLLNSDPNSLLFYLLTNLYKEGNAKDMRKWAYEIHSSFLVPGAPLRLANVDENIAHEIDDNLMREYDKEEILRKIFWKPRARAKEELTRQLNHFQQKRTAGLGTMYGPPDAKLYDMNHEKARELKIYENLLVDKLEPYLEEVERENYDPKKYYTAAALATVIIRIFGLRAVPPLDRFPTFVSKEKAFRPKFMNMKYSRKLTIQGHQFTAQQYYTVITCNHCHQIIYGIGPQGYQCSVCLINLHRMCVRLYEDQCPGPINKKDRGIQKVMEKIHRRKPSNQTQLDRRQDDKDSAETADTGDMKSSHSLTRTDSDRRPDAKTETPTQDGQDHGQNNEDDATNAESTKSLPPAPSDKKKNSSSINRSESVKESSEKQKKQRRNFSDPLRPHNIGDSANLDSANFWSGSTGSSSNSSINSNSRCSNDSPSTGNTGCDSDGINEADLNDWLSGLTPEEQHRIPPHEKQRQEIINELLSTEISHVKNLGILDRVFLRGIKERGLLKDDELQLVFPNLPEIKKIHSSFAKLLRQKKSQDGALWKDIGDILLEMFHGSLGETFQKAAATFCEKQQVALNLIKEKRRKDPFSTGLNELEQNRECRRLTLQGFILTEMQRLSKYPLIIERLIGTIEKNANVQDGVEYSDAELGNLSLAAERAREIINHVNEAAKRAWGRSRLQEIQSHLDTTQFTTNKEYPLVNEYKNIDLTTYTLIHEGTVLLKRQNKAHQPLHMLLLEEAVIFLIRDGDQRFVLKFFQCGKLGQPLLPPIIKMSASLIFRVNAATDCSLFLVNTSTQNSSMYELLTKDNSERKTWLTHLDKALAPFCTKDGKAKNTEPSTDVDETVSDLPNNDLSDVAERAETVGGAEPTPSETEDTQNGESSAEDKPVSSSAENEDTSSDNDTVGGGVSTKFTADDWPLIQPSEVHANIPPVNYAEAVLTPIEKLNRKNDEVRKALEDREKLVADIFNIPRDDYHHIMDMASEESKNETDVVSKEPTVLISTSLYQLDQLLKAVNESYIVTDAEEVLLKAGSGKGQSCASNSIRTKKEFVPQAASIIHGVQGSLTQLLSVIQSREEERMRLRKELERTREQLHAKLSLDCATYTTEDAPPDLVPSGDLESIQESLTENDAN